MLVHDTAVTNSQGITSPGIGAAVVSGLELRASVLSPAQRDSQPTGCPEGEERSNCGSPLPLSQTETHPSPIQLAKSWTASSAAVLPRLPLRTKHQGTGALQDASRLFTLAVLSLLLAACGKSETPKLAAIPAPAPAPVPAISDAKLDAEITQALTSPLEEPETHPAPDALADEVADIRRRHPGKNVQQLLEVPEVKAKLQEATKELIQSKDLQNRLNSSVAAAASLKGLDTAPGTHAFKLDLSGYSDGRTNQLLHAVMSGSATRIVDFLVGEVGEATPELSLGGVQKSSNGISIDPVDPPQKP